MLPIRETYKTRKRQKKRRMENKKIKTKLNYDMLSVREKIKNEEKTIRKE